MLEGILVITVFCMFVLGFYIAWKADEFWDKVQEDNKAKEEEKKQSSNNEKEF
ncbi:hypothetical protein [Agathobacter sp.]